MSMNAVDPPRVLAKLTAESLTFREKRRRPAWGKPNSRVFNRGVLGDSVDARSREGRFLRKCEAELLAQIGGYPTFAQKMLIRRAARAMLRLELLDEKAARGHWTDHDARTFGGLNNAVRLLMREMAAQTPKAEKDKALDLGDIVARHNKGAAT
jgi:hypothetical protein